MEDLKIEIQICLLSHLFLYMTSNCALTYADSRYVFVSI